MLNELIALTESPLGQKAAIAELGAGEEEEEKERKLVPAQVATASGAQR